MVSDSDFQEFVEDCRKVAENEGREACRRIIRNYQGKSWGRTRSGDITKDACEAAVVNAIARYKDDMVFNVGWDRFTNQEIRNYASDAKERGFEVCSGRISRQPYHYHFHKRHKKTCKGAVKLSVNNMAKCLRNLKNPVVY